MLRLLGLILIVLGLVWLDCLRFSSFVFFFGLGLLAEVFFVTYWCLASEFASWCVCVCMCVSGGYVCVTSSFVAWIHSLWVRALGSLE